MDLHVQMGPVLLISYQNDLIPDCPNATDELEYERLISGRFRAICENADEVPCIPGHSKCITLSKLCQYEYDVLGNMLHCRNAAHLQVCDSWVCHNSFKCLRSYCIPFQYVCDSQKDCPSGDDEESCSKGISCPGMFKCKESTCIVAARCVMCSSLSHKETMKEYVGLLVQKDVDVLGLLFHV